MPKTKKKKHVHPIYDLKVQNKLDKVFVPGIEREYTEEEMNMVDELLFAKELREFEQRNSEGSKE